LPFVEDFTGVADLLIEEDNFNDLGTRIEGFRDIFKKITLSIKIYCDENNIDESGQIVISREIDFRKIHYKAKISLIQCIYNLEEPRTYIVDFTHFENFKQFCRHIDPIVVWLNAKSNICYHVSLKIKLLQEDMDADIVYNVENQSYSIEPSFYKSIESLHFDLQKEKAEMLLRALAEEVLEKNMRDTHKIRVSKGGNSDQLKYNGFRAWRRDIDHEYHIHYWKKEQVIKFMDLVPHNKLSISYF
jgi:Txe/YoeB family toxin of Txe-Axe toxin-antitoxin module